MWHSRGEFAIPGTCTFPDNGAISGAEACVTTGDLDAIARNNRASEWQSRPSLPVHMQFFST
jgi:hypothetical protein